MELETQAVDAQGFITYKLNVVAMLTVTGVSEKVALSTIG